MKLTNKYKSKREQGFTIIEVLIVLAIAGLIILIVFLAVPALQRNSRNTQRRNDVSAILGGLQEYVNNIGGSLPAAGSPTAITNNVKLGYYEAGNVTLVDVTAGGTTNDDDVNALEIVKGAKCSGDNATDTDAGSRAYVVLFSVETSNATDPQCQES